MPEELKEITLKVAEALQIDYAKRIVRLDANARKMLGVTTGDVVEIRGKKTTAAIVLPAHPQDEGLNIIRMDGILRQNTSVGLGDSVRVRKAEIKEAKKIVLAPNQPTRYAPGFDSFVKKNLVGKPLSKGDILSINVFGTSFPFAVAQTVPAGLVLVGGQTNVELREEPVKELGKIATISYEDIGGLKDEVQKIREMVELPMRHPELFERLGIEAPKGVLIHGTPGCGKTLLAKAVANESEAHFITIAGPEIVSKFVGEAEERLRGIFKDAEENAPSIIFIDEIDSIAPKREEVLGEVEKRIVSQLLSSMDGLKSRGQVVVIAASVTGDTPIMTKDERGARITPISEFVDSHYAEGEADVEKPAGNVYTLGFSSKKSPNNFNNSSFDKAEFKKVRGVFRHKVNEIYEIEFNGGTVKATGNHSVFVRTKQGVKAKPVSELKIGESLVDLPLKTRTTNGFRLSAADVASAFPAELALDENSTADYYESVLNNAPVKAVACEMNLSPSTVNRWRHGATPNLLRTVMARGLKQKIALTPALMRLLGYYAAEGYARNEVDFCFGTHEQALIKDVQQLMLESFNAEATTRVTGSRTNVVFQSKLLANFFVRMCGKGAHNKHVPQELFTLPKEYFLEFFKGVLEGDGYVDKTGRIEITSVSKQLVTELNWLCRMHGIKAYAHEFTAKEGRRIKNGKPLKATRAYRLGVGALNNPFAQTPLNKLKIHRPIIKKITRVPFDGYVYDLCGCENEAFFGGETPVLLHNTNRVNALDPALRRPGRFDREIEIGVPDKAGRKEILQIHTRGMPLTEDVSLDDLAAHTHGFVGADLQSLTKEAAMKALRRTLPKIKLEDEQIPQEILDSMRVTAADFHNAQREIRPSALREVYLEVPNVKWEQIGGLDEAKRELKEAVELPLKCPEAFTRVGIRPARGILLYGPPGTGKTLLAKAVATESEANFIAIRGPELISKWVGESLAYDEPVWIAKDGGLERIEIGKLVDEMVSENEAGGETQALKQKTKLLTFTVNEEGKSIAAPVDDFIRHAAPSEIYKITTQTGREIKVTDDHALFTLTNGTVSATPANCLVTGETRVAVPARLPTLEREASWDLIELFAENEDVLVKPTPLFAEAVSKLGFEKTAALLNRSLRYVKENIAKAKNALPLPLFLKLATNSETGFDAGEIELSYRGSTQTLPGRLNASADLCYAAGFWVAEGDYNGCSLRFSNCNEENRRELFETLARLGVKPKAYKGCIRAEHPLLQSVFKRALALEHFADNKRVPNFLFSAPRRQIAAFLRGYYSGDGSVHGNAHRYYVEASTSSATLARDVQHLLLHFGIVATLWRGREKRTGGNKFKVLFTGVTNFERFLEIGFSENKKQHRLAAYPAAKKWRRSAQIPLDANTRAFLATNGFEKWVNSETIGVDKLRQALEHCDAQRRFKTAWTLVESDYYWDKITRIEKIPYGKPFVYDVSVPGPQRFLAGYGDLLVHNSEKGVREVFRKARTTAPCIVFLDEIDSLAPSRGGGEDGGTHVMDRVVNTLLAEMDGLQDLSDVVVIGATNQPQLLDPALLRPGRFDKLVEVPAPDEVARLAILQVHTKNMPIIMDNEERSKILAAKGILNEESLEAALKQIAKKTDKPLSDLKTLLKKTTKKADKYDVEDLKKLISELLKEFLEPIAKKTDGYSGADLEGLCREAGMVALRENINAKEVKATHFQKALGAIRPSLVLAKKTREAQAGYG